MKLIRADELPLVPAGHENPVTPGCWKRVLCGREDFQAGHVQMVNWAKLPVGSCFAPHYHEDMQELFVIVRGTAEIAVDGRRAMLGPGDAVLIDAREVHQMWNRGDEDCEYLALGVSAGTHGRTVVVVE